MKIISNVRKGDKVRVKLGTKLPWSNARVIKKRGNSVVIHAEQWGAGVTGTINKKYVIKSR